jgi:predicted methyltransferase MtxX (methanogen marker protein 4)
MQAAVRGVVVAPMLAGASAAAGSGLARSQVLLSGLLSSLLIAPVGLKSRC